MWMGIWRWWKTLKEVEKLADDAERVEQDVMEE